MKRCTVEVERRMDPLAVGLSAGSDDVLMLCRGVPQTVDAVITCKGSGFDG